MNKPRHTLGVLPRAVPLPSARPVTRRLPSPIWLVPVFAALIGGWLAARAAWQRGTTITINFLTAEGLEAQRTSIKYKNVDIGVIKHIALREDRAGVTVTAEVSHQASRLLVEDARLWVVRPRVSMAGVSGIGTLLSGAHIGFDAGASVEPRHEFTGLETPPPIISDRQGRRFVLRGDNIGSLDIGAPIYLRRLQVGQITSVALDEGATGVVLEVFVNAPYDQHVTTNTRFWNASGLDLTVGARGIKLDTQSVASVLLGGIAFQAPADEATAPTAAAGAEFKLFEGQKVALRSSGAAAERYSLTFPQPVRGLAAGAPVELLGLEVGEVLEVNVDFDPRTAQQRTVVAISLDPARLRLQGSPEIPPFAAVRQLLPLLVERGLRAQIRSGNILTDQRFVALDFVRGAPRARLDMRTAPIVFPTVDGDPTDLQASARRMLAKLEAVPTEQLAAEAMGAAQEMRRTFEGTSKLVNRFDTEMAPQLGALMGQARRTLGSVEGTMAADAPLQRDLRSALRDVGGAGQALHLLSEYLQRHPESLVYGKKSDHKGEQR